MVAQAGVKTSYKIPVKTTGIAKVLKIKGLLMIHTKEYQLNVHLKDLPKRHYS